jgi:pentatricopeptide repeat protein
MVGKELLELDYASDNPGKTILSTYVPTSCGETASETVASDSLAAGDDDDSFKDAISEEEKEGVAEMKTVRPSFGAMLDDDPEVDAAMNGQVDSSVAVPMKEKESHAEKDSNTADSDLDEAGYQTPDEDLDRKAGDSKEPRRRFRDSLSALQIEEAKATGRAQLGLAFEMLTMMKKRALKADPEAYQCLIDACGRVGDTNRATDLLAKMHEDGIVADGTVYACLVSAFSAESASAWKKGTKEEDLPGTMLVLQFTYEFQNHTFSP